MNGTPGLQSGIYQSLERLFLQDNNPGLLSIDLTPAQQKTVLTILSGADLTTDQTRKNLITEIKANPTIARIIRCAIGSLNINEKNSQNLDYFTFDTELNRAILDTLQETTQLKFYDRGPEMHDWLTKFGNYFDEATINSLESFDLFNLAALLSEPDNKNHELHQTIYSNLPRIVQKYYQLLCKPQRNNTKISKITQILDFESSTSETRYLLLAHYISYEKIPMKLLKGILTEEQLLGLMPHLRYGDFRDISDDLTQKLLTKTTQLKQLYINSKTIRTLPQQMLSLQELYTHGCIKLKSLPPCMPALQTLNTWGCLRLKHLPQEMPALKKFACWGCTSLESLPQHMPSLQKLDCSWCKSLRTLPREIPNLQKLECRNCTVLEKLPVSMPALLELICTWCENLKSLPLELPALQSLECDCCHSLDGYMPEMPSNVKINTNYPPKRIKRFEVDVLELASSPKKILLQLGKAHLLRNSPLPYTYYTENEVPLDAVDDGGLRRDFISRLMESIFVQSDTGDNKLLLDRQGTPQMDDHVDTAHAYRILGKIMTLCYAEHSYLKTGPLFKTEVYRRLASMPGQNLEFLPDKEIVSLFQKFMNMPVEVADVINNLQNNIVLDETAIAHFNAVIDLGDDECDSLMTNTDVQAFLQDPQNRQKLINEIRKEVLNNKSIQALNFIAMGIKGLLESKWTDFCSQDATTIHDRIEGTLTKDKLLEKITWAKSASVSESQVDKARLFITNWIERADLEALRKFVRAVTSNNTLGSDNLCIEIYDREPDFIPIAHTCFFTLEVTHSYPDQEYFDKKLELLLTEGMEGSGFQAM